MASLRPRRLRRPKTAFVLSGGGNLGALQVGMLRALTERGISPDIVLGCSVGALNGAAFCVDPTLDGVAGLAQRWRDLAESPDSMMPSSRMPNPVQILRKGPSLHPNDGVRSTIEAFLDGRRLFSELDVPFQCVATDVDAAIETWFSEGELVEPIVASAALPAVYPMVTIDGRRFVDGGVVNNVPIARAVELGARQIYVLQMGLHGRPSPEVRRPLDGWLIAYWVARNSRFARDLLDLPRRVEAVVLPPGDRPELRYDDFSQTEQLMEQGYTNAVAHLDALADDSGEDGETRRARLAEEVKRVVDQLRSGSSDGTDGLVPPSEPDALEDALDELEHAAGDDPPTP